MKFLMLVAALTLCSCEGEVRGKCPGGTHRTGLVRGTGDSWSVVCADDVPDAGVCK